MSAKDSHYQTYAEQERARAEALFSSIGDGVIATDEHGVISEVNHVAEQILGYTAKDLLGKWFPKVIQAVNEDGKALDLMERPVAQAMLSGHPISGTTWYKTRSRKRVPVALTVSPILLGDSPIGAIEVFRDISHEYEIDRMKSEFISIASHQLRTPLTAIKTYSHMLASGFSGPLNQSQSEFMDIILGSIDRMNELINTLLDITRIEEGQMLVSRQFVDLETVVDEIVIELQPVARAKKIKLSIDYKSDNLNAQTDPLMIKEICANLLSNALKYTPPGGQVSISVSATSKNFIFIIEDTGYGIPRREQSRVFSKFFRGENIMDKETSGTGLGLYLVKQLVESLGGTVSFKSVENKGSRFRFTIPRRPLTPP